MLQKKVDTVPFFSAQNRVSYKENYQSSKTRNCEYQGLLTFCERGRCQRKISAQYIPGQRFLPSLKHCLLRVKDLILNVYLYFHSVLPPLIFVSLYPQNNHSKKILSAQKVNQAFLQAPSPQETSPTPEVEQLSIE